ncbi:MAG: UDP-3-O-(3-hydroxymyristoyl)glucosamine N-acyltransferase [Alphaproteobacteria bacterium]|nr:UDP-3-O-(3-hydroxymyristoyl)glucosamine N-acyltransferase [Alphaproteobacteria bacterium]
MADPRFFASVGPFSAGEVAARIGASLSDAKDASRQLSGVAPLDAAGPADLSFIDNRRYVDAFAATKAGAVIATASDAPRAPAGCALLLSATPYLAFALAAGMFHPDPAPTPGVHPSAVVDPSAEIGAAVEIGPGAVVGEKARIGARCRIGANAVIGRGVEIGEACDIGACASLSHCSVGARALIHPGVRIGTRGFGFAPSAKGFVKVPQLGRVLIGDDVEIGANSTIDRGAGPDTVIGSGCMIDNLVQIGHNVRLGRGCIVVAQAGVAGSTHLGDYVVVGAQVGITGHLTIGDRARVAAQSGVMRDVSAGETVGGSPAVPQREWLRQCAWLNKASKRRDP